MSTLLMEVKYCMCTIGTAFSVRYMEYGDVYISARCKMLCTMQIQPRLQILSNLSAIENCCELISQK